MAIATSCRMGGEGGKSDCPRNGGSVCRILCCHCTVTQYSALRTPYLGRVGRGGDTSTGPAAGGPPEPVQRSAFSGRSGALSCPLAITLGRKTEVPIYWTIPDTVHIPTATLLPRLLPHPPGFPFFNNTTQPAVILHMHLLLTHMHLHLHLQPCLRVLEIHTA